jgi:hypothetical protein
MRPRPLPAARPRWPVRSTNTGVNCSVADQRDFARPGIHPRHLPHQTVCIDHWQAGAQAGPASLVQRETLGKPVMPLIQERRMHHFLARTGL